MGFSEEDHRGGGKSYQGCILTLVGKYAYQYNLSMLILLSITWPMWCLSGAHILKLFSSLFPSCSFGKKVSMCCPPVSGDYAALPWSQCKHISYLKLFSMRDLSLLSHLFGSLFIKLWTRGSLFYTLGHNPILLFLTSVLGSFFFFFFLSSDFYLNSM